VTTEAGAEHGTRPLGRSPVRAAWHEATVAEVHAETSTAVRVVLDVPSWPGNLPGAHLDLRLTAPDGYHATRSYSIASSGTGESARRLVLAVDEVPGGEVSPFLVHDLRPGDQLQVHGPLGAFFVWRPEPGDRPVQLVAGGSGVVPLYAMAAGHVQAGDLAPFRLLYSVRTPGDVFFADELATLAGPALETTYVYTRQAPVGWTGRIGRLTREAVEAHTISASLRPRVFICGPTGFVEAASVWLQDLGHAAEDIRTERFGGTSS